MRIILVLLTALGGALGQPILFEDSFNDPALGGAWTHTVGPTPSVVNGALQLDAGGRVFAGDPAWMDTSLTVRWQGLVPTWVIELLFRRNPITDAAWSLLVNSSGTVQIRTQSGTVVAQSTATVSGAGWNSAHVRAIGDTITVFVQGQPVFSQVSPPLNLAQARVAGQIGLAASNLCAFDDVLVDRACDGVGVTLTSDSTYGFAADVCTEFPGRPIVVIMNSAAIAVPLGPYGFTQVALAQGVIPLAAPFSALGPPVDPVALTDAFGGWSMSFPAPILFWLYGPGTVYVEAFIIDASAPNGLFHQSNLASLSIL